METVSVLEKQIRFCHYLNKWFTTSLAACLILPPPPNSVASREPEQQKSTQEVRAQLLLGWWVASQAEKVVLNPTEEGRGWFWLCFRWHSTQILPNKSKMCPWADILSLLVGRVPALFLPGAMLEAAEPGDQLVLRAAAWCILRAAAWGGWKNCQNWQ